MDLVVSEALRACTVLMGLGGAARPARTYRETDRISVDRADALISCGDLRRETWSDVFRTVLTGIACLNGFW